MQGLTASFGVSAARLAEHTALKKGGAYNDTMCAQARMVFALGKNWPSRISKGRIQLLGQTDKTAIQ